MTDRAATIWEAEVGNPNWWGPAESDLSPAAYAIPLGVIWSRIESFCNYRWAVRTVDFVIQGPGDWISLILPFTAEFIWKPSSTGYLGDYLWQFPEPGGEAGTNPEPNHLYFTGEKFVFGDDRYFLRGTAGREIEEGTPLEPPAPVVEAFKRLAEYYAAAQADTSAAGVSRFSKDIGGQIVTQFSRSPQYIARAMQYSGAADLLRAYRYKHGWPA